MKKAQIKVTLKYHPNKAIGEKYECVKIVNAVTVEYYPPQKRDAQVTLRVSDYIDEAHAKAVADVAEVTIVPE